jgi:glucose-6-phosphate isomerase
MEEDEIFISEVIVYHKDKQLKLGYSINKFENRKYYSYWYDSCGVCCSVFIGDMKYIKQHIEKLKNIDNYIHDWREIK